MPRNNRSLGRDASCAERAANVLATAFRCVVRDLDLPKDLQIRDARAGGILARGIVTDEIIKTYLEL